MTAIASAGPAAKTRSFGYPGWRPIAPWAALLGLAVSLRLLGITTTSIWHDEAVSILVARMGWYDMLVRMSLADHQLPLFYALLKLWRIPSEDPTWLRLLPVALSLPGVIFAVRWLQLWDNRAGWLAGLLVATNPLLVHYAQEIRAYSLMYSATLAALYYSERLSRRNDRRSAGWAVFWTTLIGYCHYVGPWIGLGIWAYAWRRRVPRRRLLNLVAGWAALMAPVAALAVYHAGLDSAHAFWIPPLTWPRFVALLAAFAGLGSGQWTFSGHPTLVAWEEAQSGLAASWITWGAGLVLLLAAALALPLGIRGRGRDRSPGAAILLSGAAMFAPLAVISLVLVPIAIERTVAAAFLPLLALVALSSARGPRVLLAWAGTAAGTMICSVWLFITVAVVTGSIERRPDENRLFDSVRGRIGRGDLLCVVPADWQASAGYFLGQAILPDQVFCPERSRLVETPSGLRLLPTRQTPDPDWVDRLMDRARVMQQESGGEHGVWVIRGGLAQPSAGDSRKLSDWLATEYRTEESYAVGERWRFYVWHYRWLGAGH